MTPKRGDAIVVESERVGLQARRGEILKVISTPAGVRYEVRWEDGRETTFTPSGGSARVITKTAPHA